MGEKSCEFCAYNWTSVVENPKSCPRCKRRFDYKDARIVLQRIGRKYGWKIESSGLKPRISKEKILEISQ